MFEGFQTFAFGSPYVLSFIFLSFSLNANNCEQLVLFPTFQVLFTKHFKLLKNIQTFLKEVNLKFKMPYQMFFEKRIHIYTRTDIMHLTP